MPTTPDLDELIASGEIEADPHAVKHARLKVLERAALAAFRADPLMLIPMVEDARQAAEKAHAKALAGPPPVLTLPRPVRPASAADGTEQPGEVEPPRESRPKRVRLTEEERRERIRARARAGYARRRDAARASVDPEVLRREEGRRARAVEAQRRYDERKRAAAAGSPRA
jgi:hypothetical protein